MSITVTLLRRSLIMGKLRSKALSWEEIEEILEIESEILGHDLTMSQRTFQRDIQDILSIYGVEIINDKSIKKYKIHNPDEENFRHLEALDVINLLKMGGNKQDSVSFEKRRPLGTEHLYELLTAINTNNIISFTHEKYYLEGTETRTVEPYLLKEFKSRWYLVGKDLGREDIRIFGLDRISNIEFRKKKCKRPPLKEIEKVFAHSFGIFRPNPGQCIEEVILSFSPQQGRYILSHPLHESQEVLENNDQETRIRLRLYITHDLIMELLSHGNRIKVLQPEHLREEMLELAFKG